MTCGEMVPGAGIADSEGILGFVGTGVLAPADASNVIDTDTGAGGATGWTDTVDPGSSGSCDGYDYGQVTPPSSLDLSSIGIDWDSLGIAPVTGDPILDMWSNFCGFVPDGSWSLSSGPWTLTVPSVPTYRFGSLAGTRFAIWSTSDPCKRVEAILQAAFSGPTMQYIVTVQVYTMTPL